MDHPTGDEATRLFIEEHFAAISSRDPDQAARRYAVDALNHAAPGGARGREHFREVFRQIFTVFPDWAYAIQRLLVDRDWVACHVIATGTHRGISAFPILGGWLVGVAPTGRSVRVPHVHLYRVQAGAIVEHVAVRDDLAMASQLGILDALARGPRA